MTDENWWAETLCGRYRMIIRDHKEKIIQRRHNIGWRDIESWPRLMDGGTLGAAMQYMNTLADREDSVNDQT